MKQHRNLAPSRVLLIPVLAVLMLGFAGCEKFITTQQCTGTCVNIGVGVRFSENVESINAWSIYETREVDASLYAHDPTSTPSGTIAVTLSSGATLSYNTTLFLDTSTVVSPTTSGHTVLVYRPTNPAALQDFIDQYQGQATSVDINTSVTLSDVSGGSGESTVVDVKGNYNSDLNYIGSVSLTTMSGDPFNKDL